MDYEMNLQTFDTVQNLSWQCEKIIQTYDLQQVVETKVGNKKWRQVILSKIKPKPFPDLLAKGHTTDSNFQSPPRASEIHLIKHLFSWQEARG
jgi:hypothetical protein